VSVRLYVEGGGDHNKALQTLCRKGFSEFLRKAGFTGRMPRIVACGGRRQAFDDFETAYQQDTQSPPVLLVDSEGPLQSRSQWAHVEQRPGDGWKKPSGATDDQLHLMVQAMEAWFHADVKELETFYGQHFRANALSRRADDVESIPKADLFSGLKAATANCQKGEYSKGDHSFHILARIDPAKVRAASPSCERFLAALGHFCK
jgi:hypothetical protein